MASLSGKQSKHSSRASSHKSLHISISESHMNNKIQSIVDEVNKMKNIMACTEEKEKLLIELQSLSVLADKIARSKDNMQAMYKEQEGKMQAMVRYLLSFFPTEKVVSVPKEWKDVESLVKRLGFDSESVHVNDRNTFMDARNTMLRRDSTGSISRKISKTKKKKSL